MVIYCSKDRGRKACEADRLRDDVGGGVVGGEVDYNSDGDGDDDNDGQVPTLEDQGDCYGRSTSTRIQSVGEEEETQVA